MSNRKIRIKYIGAEMDTTVEGLADFTRGHPKTFGGAQAEKAADLVETNVNFEEVPLLEELPGHDEKPAEKKDDKKVGGDK